jgi:hypothetical protein
MARWKLACPHYINTVRPAKWRYSHTDRASGDLVEKEFIVPRLLDPADPKCWTNRNQVGVPVSAGGNMDDAEGEVIVFKGKGLPGEIEIFGDPTPDMIPQDEEAQEISDSFQSLWAYKPERAEQNYSQAVVDRADVTPQPIMIPGMDQLVGALASLTQLMAEQQLASRAPDTIRLKG